MQGKTIIRKLISALLAVFVICSLGQAHAAPSSCTITGAVYGADGRLKPSAEVQFWYAPNAQNISGGIVTVTSTPIIWYTGPNGQLPSGVTLIAGEDIYIQVDSSAPQLAYVPIPCTSIDLNALMGNPDPPLSPVVTSIGLNNTSSLSASVTNPVGIGEAILNISGLINSAGSGTISFDNSGDIVANGDITAKGGYLVAGVPTVTQGCVALYGGTSGEEYLCAPATGGNTLIMPNSAGAAGNVIQTDGSGNLSFVAQKAAARGGADGLAIAANGTTQMTASALDVAMVTPSTGVTTYVTSFSATDTVVGSQSGSVANERDQTAAFSDSTFYHLYAIGGGGQTPALLASLTGPPTGPTLPASYTAWAYLGTFMTTSGGNVTAEFLQANEVYLEANQSLTTGGNTTATQVAIATYVPAIAQTYEIYTSLGASSVSTSGSVQFFIGLTSTLSTTAARFYSTFWANAATSDNGGSTTNTLTMANNQNATGYYFKFADPNSTGATFSSTQYLLGYSVPNNSD